MLVISIVELLHSYAHVNEPDYSLFSTNML